MMRIAILGAASLFLFLSLALHPMAVADELKKVDGHYSVAKPDGQIEPELGLIIYGTAAKKTYEQLAVPEKEDICTGGKRKDAVGGLQCLEDSGQYTCSVGFGLTTGKISAGPLTC